MSVSSDDRTLYIGNLDKKVSDDVLYELFLQAGPVERVNIVTNNNNTSHFGFVTYKHEVSVDYALQLYKGTYLFNKELAIKKRGKKNGNGQVNEFGKHGLLESFDTQRYPNTRLFDPDQVQSEEQNFRLSSICDTSPVFNFKSNSQEGNWSRSKSYDHGSRNYSSRSHEQRRMYKGRPPVSKPYHNRKNRY